VSFRNREHLESFLLLCFCSFFWFDCLPVGGKEFPFAVLVAFEHFSSSRLCWKKGRKVKNRAESSAQTQQREFADQEDPRNINICEISFFSVWLSRTGYLLSPLNWTANSGGPENLRHLCIFQWSVWFSG